MEKKQGFFSSLRDEVVRGLSPSRSRPRSRSASPSRSNPHMKALLWGRKKLIASSGGCSGGGGYYLPQPETVIGRSGSLRPVMEGPDPDNGEMAGGGDSKRLGSGLSHWVKGQWSRAPSVTSTPACRRSDVRLLLGVMGAPLAPINVSSCSHLLHLTIRDSPIVSLSLFSNHSQISSFFKYLSFINFKFLSL